MVFSSRLFDSDESHAHFGGAQGKVMQDAFTVALPKLVLPPVGIFLALGKHRVNQPRQRVGRGGNGQSQCLGGTAGHALGHAAHHFAAGDLGARAVVTSTPSIRVRSTPHIACYADLPPDGAAPITKNTPGKISAAPAR